MIKTEKQEVTEIKDVPVSITCNCCGEESEEVQYNAQYQEIYLSFGYGSQFDMETWSIHLCEDCLVKYIKTFKVAPSGFGEDNMYGYNDHNQKENQKYFEKWRDQ